MKYKRINIVEPESEKPEEDVITVESSRLIDMRENCGLPSLRSHGELEDMAIFLRNPVGDIHVDWIIVRDNQDVLCAVPLRQKA